MLITHVGETLRKNAEDLLSREDLSGLLEELRKKTPHLVDDIKPDVIRVSDIHVVLRHLLAERVPITNLVRILECILQHAHKVKDAVALSELVRVAMGREILDRFRDDTGTVHSIIIEPHLENELLGGLREGALSIPADALERMAERLRQLRQESLARDQEAVLIADSLLRRPLRNVLERTNPDLVVIGYAEIPRDLSVEFRHIVKAKDVFQQTLATTTPDLEELTT